MYIAQAYIGGQYAPADAIPDDAPKEFIERPLKAGAIKHVNDGEIVQIAAAVETADENEAGPVEEAPQDEKEPESESIFDDEAAPEEIDVMEGLVGKGTKKSARRRKTT